MKPSMQLKIVFDGDMINIDTPNDFPFIDDSMKKEIDDMYIEHGLYFGLLKGKCDCCKHDRDSFGLQANSH